MAAVLCSGIGDCLKASCNTIGKVITLPCRACGFACDTMGDVLTSPFFPYLALTFGLNMPGLVYGAMSIVKDCPNLGNWMIANGVLALVHMIAALYIVKKIRETSSSHDTQHKSGDSEAPSTNYSNFTVPNRDQHGAANSFTRIKHVLCYDKTVAVYIIIFIGWIVWLCIGMARRFSADGEDCDQEVKWMNVIISCGYIYLSMVFVAFGCSLCCLR